MKKFYSMFMYKHYLDLNSLDFDETLKQKHGLSNGLK